MADLWLEQEDRWTYDGDPANIARDHVRELIGDTDRDKKKVGDNSIALALSEKKNAYFAAAKLCRQIATKFSDRPPISHEGLSEQWPTVVDNYIKLADLLEKEGSLVEGKADGTSAPMAIAHSLSALTATLNDADRNHAVFSEGMLWDSRFDPRRR